MGCIPAKNDTYFRHLKPAEKDYKKADSGGPYMFVTKTGSKLWRYGYRFDEKQMDKFFSFNFNVVTCQSREQVAMKWNQQASSSLLLCHYDFTFGCDVGPRHTHHVRSPLPGVQK